MKTSLVRLAAAVGLSIGTVALPTTAFAGGGGGGPCAPAGSGQVMSCHFSGLFAEAGYRAGSWETSETDVSLGAMDGRSLDSGSGAPTAQSAVYITISKFQRDPSNPFGKPVAVVQLFGYVPLTSGFTIDRGLGTASLNSVEIPLYGFDETGPVNGRVVTVGAIWTGTGTVTRSSFSWSFRSGDFIFRERFASANRNAAAVSSVADGTNDWITGLSQVYADLQSTSDASLTVSLP